MALTPDKTRIENGVTIHEKIIPWGAVWPKTVYDSAGKVRFAKGSRYKADQLLSSGTGRVQGVTIHNTDGSADAETYTRATWPNGNMNDVRVHYYCDDREAWQNLLETEVGWHAADGTGPGNQTTIAIEIVMRGKAIADDAKAEDNGARLAASILRRYGLSIDALHTHNFRMYGGDAPMPGARKNCPLYILPHWAQFRAQVQSYLAALGGTAEQINPRPTEPTEDFSAGDTVTIRAGAVYGGASAARGGAVPAAQLSPKVHTVAKTGTHGGQAEALLKEINSWVAVKYLEATEQAAPEPSPTPSDPVEDTDGYTRITGEAVATAAQMRAYLEAENPEAAAEYGRLAEIYLTEGAKEGIRGDVAFAQSLVETACFRFGGDVKPEQNNFAGIGAVGGGAPGNSFSAPEIGIRAQIQHLKAYANSEPLKGACVDPRFDFVERGTAPFAEWLGIPDNPKGKGWAAGKGYGAAILKRLKGITETAAPAPAPVEPPQDAQEKAATLDEVAALLKQAGITSIKI